MQEPRHPVAAPADSAGHMGSQTLPGDLEQVPDGEGRFPETNQDVNPKREPAGRNWSLIAAVVFVLLLLGLWVGRYMIL